MDAIEALRNRRHLAAFLGDCGQRTCTVCHPAETIPVPEWRRRAGIEIAKHGNRAAHDLGR